MGNERMGDWKNRELGRPDFEDLEVYRLAERLAYSRQLLTCEQVDKLKPIIDELPPKLNAYLKSRSN
jgi:hypothetical protein